MSFAEEFRIRPSIKLFEIQNHMVILLMAIIAWILAYVDLIKSYSPCIEGQSWKNFCI